jgi:hypothetical protein
MEGGGMTDEEINMATAESVGWQNVHKPGFPGLVLGIPPEGWSVKTTHFPNYYAEHYEIPRFASDLNEMHNALKLTLEGDEKLFWAFDSCLRDLIFPGWYASAGQLAEAYLRTIGKWKEGE